MVDSMDALKVKNIEAEINAIFDDNDLATSISVLDLALSSLNAKIASTKLHQRFGDAAFIIAGLRTKEEVEEAADKGVVSVLSVIVLSALSTVYRESYNHSQTVKDFCQCVAQSHVTVANALAVTIGDQSNLSKMVLHTVDANAERITNIIELDRENESEKR